MQPIETMLRETMGLDAASIGQSTIQRCVRQRMKQLGLKKAEAYQELLGNSAAEWNELVEAVIVTETWFFRDREPFATLAHLVLSEWLPANPQRELRLLSVPCASGEEPYSMVMTLLEAGVSPDRFQVDAVDISARALARAARGVFRSISFRGKDLSFRERYFRSTREGYLLNDSVRECVTFSQGNLLGPDFLPGREAYDFIFCRNLLIYFDRPTQRRTFETIRRLLRPSGILFTGAAEQLLTLDHGFVSARIPMSFACRRAEGAPATRSDRRTRSSKPYRIAITEAPHRVGAVLPAAGNRLAAATQEQGAGPDLDHARRLADAGRLKEAAEICENFLLVRGASAEAYYLLGLVRDAASDNSAAEYYRRALYLEPGHYETLLQMALLAQKNGDPARARAFRERAERSRLQAASLS